MRSGIGEDLHVVALELEQQGLALRDASAGPEAQIRAGHAGREECGARTARAPCRAIVDALGPARMGKERRGPDLANLVGAGERGGRSADGAERFPVGGVEDRDVTLERHAAHGALVELRPCDSALVGRTGCRIVPVDLPERCGVRVGEVQHWQARARKSARRVFREMAGAQRRHVDSPPSQALRQDTQHELAARQVGRRRNGFSPVLRHRLRCVCASRGREDSGDVVWLAALEERKVIGPSERFSRHRDEIENAPPVAAEGPQELGHPRVNGVGGRLRDAHRVLR